MEKEKTKDGEHSDGSNHGEKPAFLEKEKRENAGDQWKTYAVVKGMGKRIRRHPRGRRGSSENPLRLLSLMVRLDSDLLRHWRKHKAHARILFRVVPAWHGA